MFLDECLAHDLLHNFRELQKIVQSGEDKSSCESSSSEALRQKANDLYKRKKLKDAIEMYTKLLQSLHLVIFSKFLIIWFRFIS